MHGSELGVETSSPPLNLVDGRGSDKRSAEPVPNCNSLHTGDAQRVINPKLFLYLGECVHIKTNVNQLLELALHKLNRLILRRTPFCEGAG